MIEPTLEALLVMESQIQEGSADGHVGLFPDDEAGWQRRRDQVRSDLARRYAAQAQNYREALVKFYGSEQAQKVRYAQAFELCEYGRQPSQEESAVFLRRAELLQYHTVTDIHVNRRRNTLAADG